MELIKDSLLMLPEKIKEKEKTLLKDKQLFEENKFIKSSIWNKLFSEVDRARNTEGKPLYSSKEKRTLETNNRSDKDESYKNIDNSQKELKEKIINSEIELSFLKRKFRSFESITRLGD